MQQVHRVSPSSDSRDMMNLPARFPSPDVSSKSRVSVMNIPELHWLRFERPTPGAQIISAKSKNVSTTDSLLTRAVQVFGLTVCSEWWTCLYQQYKKKNHLIQLGPIFQKIKDAKPLIILY